MKKMMLLALVIGFMANAANSQNFIVRAGVGAGYGLAYYNGYFGNETKTTSTDELFMKSTSLGSGFNINVGFAYMFSKYLGVDLGLNGFIGFPIKSTYNNTQAFYSDQSDDKTSCKMFQIIPAVVITPGLEKINPYMRLGAIIGVLNRISYANNDTRTLSTLKATTRTENYKEQVRGGVALGVAAAIGVDYNLTGNLALYAEVDYNGLNYAPTKGKYTSWTIDGVDQLPSATTKEKEWEYVKKLDDATTIPDDSPNKVQKQSASLSNVGINIGVKFRFGSSK
jgi:opacity protein-like surface antigen